MFKDLKLVAKLCGGFGAVALIILILALVVISHMRALYTNVQTASSLQHQAVTAKSLQFNVESFRETATDACLVRDRKELDNEVAGFIAAAKQDAAELVRMGAGDASEQAKLKELGPHLDAMFRSSKAMYAEYGKGLKQGNVAMEEFDKTCESTMKSVDNIAVHALAELKSGSDLMQQRVPNRRFLAISSE